LGVVDQRRRRRRRQGGRGLAKVALGGLESYRGTDPRIDDLLAHKDALIKLVDAFTSDGSFQKRVDKDAKRMALDVRLTGKSLSEVLPVGAILPAMGLGFLRASREASARPVSEPAVARPAMRTPVRELPPNPFGHR